MNRFIQAAVRNIHGKLEKTVNGWDALRVQQSEGSPYHSLSPISNAEVADYVEALRWALDNCKKENIYNIALTGPYGSGKSSILKTFEAQNKNEKNVFLEISLATFKEELDEKQNIPALSTETIDNNDNGSSTIENRVNAKKSEEMLRLIELSILQQIFYHEEDSKIPDSRFKKIKSFKKTNMAWVTAGIITALLFGYYLFAPRTFQQLLDIHLENTASIIIRWISFVVFLASISIIIFRSIRLLYGIQISKFKIQEAEIEIDKNISKSILNNHLDEILYFFEVTDYSVVFIEDLDRFRQAEIFTKLRELNLLIKKSKKVKQDVIFIYAVRDEIFREKERTKFFDFIIPVIPVINASNSNETLLKIIEKNAYVIGKDLVEDISLFIDDMRLLYNIMNEYHLYHNLLTDELDQNKLLAMIIYKNIYPEDFVELSNEKGNLFKLLNNRKEYVAKTVEEFNRKIAEFKKEIKIIEAHTIKDVIDLRLIYLAAYVDNAPGFASFIVDGVEKTNVEIAQDEDFFDLVISNKIKYNYYTTQNSWYYKTVTQTVVKFGDIENMLDPDQDFERRQSLITDNNNDKAEEYKHEIQTLEKAKSWARHAKVKTLLTDKKITIPDGDRQHQLFGILLRNGYIDEDYLDYISLFYEGSITKEDRSYLLGVKNQSGPDYDFKLTKIENLIDKMRAVDFQESYSLNYHLLDFLLENSEYDVQLNAVINQINATNNYGSVFMEGFLLNGRNIERFIYNLVAKWKEIWHFVNKDSDFTRERKKEYLKLILLHTEIEDLKKITPYSDFCLSIATTSDFLTLLADDKRTKEVIAALNIKFVDLDLSAGTREMVDFIYEGNHYQIRQQIVEKMIGHAGKFNRRCFESTNYTSIKDSESPKLMSYIVANIDNYIQNLYLKIETNVQEPEERLRELLNDERIGITNRIKIIQQVNTEIDEISGIVGADIRKALLAESKVEATWENVINAFEYDGNDVWTEVVSFMNRTENATILSEENIEPDELTANIETIRSFCLALIQEPNIDNGNHEKLLGSVSEIFELSEIGDLALKKMALAVNSYLIFNNAENFAKLKVDYPNLQRKLLDAVPEAFLENIASYELDSEDLRHIIDSEGFTTEQKNTIFETVDASLITDSRNVLTAIVKLKFKDSTLKVSKSIREAIFKTVISVDDRVKFFNMHYQFYTKTETREIFASFPYPYSDIGVIYKSPVLPFGKENEYLSNNLVSKGFIANTKPDKKGYRIINFKK